MSGSGWRTDDELAALDVCGLLSTCLPAVTGGPTTAAMSASPGTAMATLPGPTGPEKRWLFGEVAVAAAIAADRVGVRPRSLVFLAEVVRGGGVSYAVTLPEPLPTPEQAALAHGWLMAVSGANPTDTAGLSAAAPSAAAAPSTGTVGSTAAAGGPGRDVDEVLARWLRTVAVIVEARQAARRATRER